jgi:hypothetical protein
VLSARFALTRLAFAGRPQLLHLLQLLRCEHLHRFLPHLRVQDHQVGLGRGDLRALRANRAFVDRIALDERPHGFASRADLLARRLEFRAMRISDRLQLRLLIVGQIELTEARPETHRPAAAHARPARSTRRRAAKAWSLPALRLILGHQHRRRCGDGHHRKRGCERSLESCRHEAIPPVNCYWFI